MKTASVSLATIFLFSLVPGLIAQTSSDKNAPLKDIEELRVIVGGMTKSAEEIGLTREKVLEATKLRLRREGISIGDSESIYTLLYVNVSVQGAAFHVLVGIYEPVQLARKPSFTCMGFTWWTGITGTHAGSADNIVGVVEECLDEFLNDYYKANPKK